MNQRRQQPPQQAIQRSITAEELDAQIQAAINDTAIDGLGKLTPIAQSMKLSRGIQAVQSALTDTIMDDHFMPLQGKSFGFKTDKIYSREIVREVLAEALLRGFHPVGNEFNIIAGTFYGAQAGMERKVKEFPGLTDFDEEYAVPTIKEGDTHTALVAVWSSYKLDGQRYEFNCDLQKTEEGKRDLRIPVRVNAGQGPDAVLGKAKRKFYARLYKKLSGISIPDGEPGDDGAIPTEGREVPPSPANRARDGQRFDPAADSSGFAEPGADG